MQHGSVCELGRPWPGSRAVRTDFTRKQSFVSRTDSPRQRSCVLHTGAPIVATLRGKGALCCVLALREEHTQPGMSNIPRCREMGPRSGTGRALSARHLQYPKALQNGVCALMQDCYPPEDSGMQASVSKNAFTKVSQVPLGSASKL